MIVKKRLTVIQVLLILIFVGCCGYLGKYFYDSHKAESGFDELKKVVEKTERADATDGYIDKRADNGIPFLDYQSNDESVNKIIYAHNMKNGTMFASLADYEDKSFYDAHKNIMYDTLYDKGEYEIVSAFTTKVGASNEFKYYDYADIESEERFNEYVTQAKSRSFYDTGVNTVYGDSLITLSTCAYHTSNERFVVIARKK